jgi:hypothetical protein
MARCYGYVFVLPQANLAQDACQRSLKRTFYDLIIVARQL